MAVFGSLVRSRSMGRDLLGSLMFVVLLVLAAPLPAAEPWGFDELMDDLSEHPVFTADFDEERSSFFLSRPLRLKGRIRFDAASSLEKIIESPFTEHIIIDDEAVVIHRVNEDGKAATRQTTRYALDNHPILAKAIQGVSNVFAGDKTLLEELYTWGLTGDRDAWELVLTPSNDRLAEFITAITVRGSGGIIDYIHTLEADSDESKLVLSNRTEP